ncbi:MAG: hypothetical protein ACERLG_08835 [Sedimentibacter sp.]
MIININRSDFKQIVKDDSLDLPKLWDGIDFNTTLDSLYNHYLDLLSLYINEKDLNKVKEICNGILKSVEEYHNGFPNKSFIEFNKTMNKLIEHPLTIYRKTGRTGAFDTNDPLMLFRVRKVQQNINYDIKDIFHTPYNCRSKISSCRYSIAGYPCLYLGTSVELCCEETNVNFPNDLTIVSRYKLERNMLYNNEIEMDVLEFGVKPKDFIIRNTENNDLLCNRNNYGRRKLDEIDLNDIETMVKYLYWYPLIAACSFVRPNRKDPFASEYVIPQLLMQWSRSQISDNKLFGIRYFSCSSIISSELGFNYVFPVSGQKYSENQCYCKVLANVFKLTKPYYINEFTSVKQCEKFLIDETEFSKI